jgi:S1-C subfamily serine protease
MVRPLGPAHLRRMTTSLSSSSSSPFASTGASFADALASTVAAAVAAVERAVVRVDRTSASLRDAARSSGAGPVERRRGAGSGLAFTDELIVTSSFHAADQLRLGVVADDGAITLRAATVIGRDPGTDLAVARVDGGGLRPATFRDLGGIGAGRFVLALGRPGRAVRASLRAIGVVGPEVRTPAGGRLDAYLETDRTLPRGFAGGPLVDLDGRVLGMNTRTLVPGADLAVPTSTLTRVADELVAHGRIARGYLGVAVYPAEVPAALAASGQGALVASLDAGGPGAKAGLLVGDVIVTLAGEPISGPDSLRLALVERAGATVDVGLVRGGEPRTIEAVIGSRP